MSAEWPSSLCVSLITNKMNRMIGSTRIKLDTAALYLSQISDLPEESLFEHGGVNIWCWLGFDRRV